MKENYHQFYFNDYRLEMGLLSRLFSRVIIFIFWIFLTALSISLIFQETSLKYLGWFFAIFILDRLIYFNQPPKKFDKNFFRKLAKDEKINLAFYAQDQFKRFLEIALEKSLISGGNFYLFLLNEFLSLRKFREVFQRLDINPKEFQTEILEEIKKTSPRKSKDVLLKDIENLVIMAYQFCNQSFLQPVHLFIALAFVKDDSLVKIFNHFKVTPDDLRIAAIFSEFQKKLWGIKTIPSTLSSFVKRYRKPRHRIMNRSWTARPTPYLDSVGFDLTDLAREEKVGFLIGHQLEYQRLVNILSRATKNNVLLVGEIGSGKETIVNHLAYQIVKDDVPPELFDKRLVMLSLADLVAGGDPSQIVARTNRIINEILGAGNVILYIPDIHNLVRTSGEHYLNVADALLPVLARSDFQVIGATTPLDFKKDIEPRSDFINTFEVINVEEINEEEAILLLSYLSLILEKQYKIVISFKAIKQAVKIAHRYFREKLLPSSAEELLKESLAEAKNRGEKCLNEEIVISVAQRKLNVPLRKPTEEEAEILLHLEEIIHQRLIDQEEAVKAVARALREYRAGLSRKGGPIATFLFIGPTGVGKTELSKILAKIQFGSEENMVRFDMSEYQDPKSLYRFIGSPDGNISGVLTESIRRKPFSLILLDEFEKAHPDILNVFLAVFDEGRITDNLGRLVDFTNTIIIATSNAHSNLIKQRIEEGKSILEISEEVKKKLTEYFRPELLNRFSQIIVFRPLKPEHLFQIAKLLLNEIVSTLREEQGIEFSFDNSIVEKLVELGYSPVYGARPLRNAISENVKSFLAEKILKNEIKRGEKICLVYKDGKFSIEKG